MTEKQTLIRNPLTVIAVFAGVAETSGAACLPFLTAEVQATYVWFLIFFPPFLVSLFFLTLNRNHRVLYAPSDYEDERNFMGFDPAGAEQVLEKFQEEKEAPVVALPEPELASGPDDPAGSEAEPQHDDTAIHADPLVFVAEELALSKVARDFKLPLLRRQTPKGVKDLVFDAVALDNNFVTVVEVVPFAKARSYKQLRMTFDRVLRYWRTLSDQERERLSFTCVAAGQSALTADEKEDVYQRMRAVGAKYPFPHRLLVYDKSDLDMGIFG